MQTNTISVSPIPQSTSVDKIKEIFHAFSVKNVHIDGKTAYVEFNDQGDLETLEIQFDNYQVAELNNAKIDTAQFDWNSLQKETIAWPSNISQQSDHWQKLHTNQSQITQPSTNLGYQEEKPTSAQASSGNQFNFGSMEQKPSERVLHGDIIPPFDKKTSMEVNFLDEQSKLGYEEEKHHEAIPQATTRQELDYTTEVNLPHHDQHKLGYHDEEKQQTSDSQRQQDQLKKKQEEEAHERFEQVKRKQEEQEARIMEKREHQRQMRQQEQRHRKQEQEKNRTAQQERHRKEEQQRQRREEQERHRNEERERQRKEEEERHRRQEQQRERTREQEQRMRRIREEEDRKHKEEERVSKELKQKLDAQREKHQKQQQLAKDNEAAKSAEKTHQAPTESQGFSKQVEAVKQVGQSIEKQLGYAVNKAKQESANLLEAGLQLLKGSDSKTQQKTQPVQKKTELGYGKAKKEEASGTKKKEHLGYEQINPKEIGLNLINSGLEFMKGTYSKFQQHFGEQANKQQQGLTSASTSFDEKPSDIGYDKWSVKPDVNVMKQVGNGQSRVLRTLVTVTLLIWVIFLLMQDTSEAIPSIGEIQLPTPTV